MHEAHEDGGFAGGLVAEEDNLDFGFNMLDFGLGWFFSHGIEKSCLK